MDLFTNKKPLGAGGFGETFLIDYNGVNAVLKLPKGDDKDFKEEAEKMKMLHNRYCVHIIDVIDYKGKTGIIMEYCPHKSLKVLLEKMKKENKKLSKKGILHLFCEIVLGLKYLHDHNVLHLDLKPDNVFVTQDNMCILGDFGLSKKVEDLEQSLIVEENSPIYSAPETITSYKSHGSADIYSLGLILYELCTMEKFYSKAYNVYQLINMQHEDNPIYKSQMDKIPEYIPNELKDMIKQCLKYKHTKRPTIYDIYHQQIIQDYINNGIKDFFKEYDSKMSDILKKNWEIVTKMVDNKDNYKLFNGKNDEIIYLFYYYKQTELMFEEEKVNIWKLIRFLSRNIGYQLLIDPHEDDKKIKYYKTEEYEDFKGYWEKSSIIAEVFPKMLEYLYVHRYNDEGDAIIEALLKEKIKEELKCNFKIIAEKYKH